MEKYQHNIIIGLFKIRASISDKIFGAVEYGLIYLRRHVISVFIEFPLDTWHRTNCTFRNSINMISVYDDVIYN